MSKNTRIVDLHECNNLLMAWNPACSAWLGTFAIGSQSFCKASVADKTLFAADPLQNVY